MNGIGGHTIEAAKKTMLITEFYVWQKFRSKRGSLHVGMRIEVAVARFLAHWFNSKTSKEATKLHPEDFAPHMDEREVSLAELTALWGAPE